MQYALAYQLNGTQTAGLDPVAKAYINAIIANGATVTSVQRNAINKFIKTGRADGWFSSVKRVYLPIWSIAAPNAIDMLTTASGTYNGTVTHAAGYVQGDGTTGYFDLGVGVSPLGLTTSSGYLFALVTQASTLGVRGLIGRAQGTSATSTLLSSNSSQLFRYNTNVSGVNGSSAGTGIISASREGGNRSIYRRTSTGKTTLINTAGADAGAIATGGNIAALATNNNAGIGFAASDFNNARMGAFGIGLGLADAGDTAFTLALRTLWETCTGQTIP
jgi:hypothetical protein